MINALTIDIEDYWSIFSRDWLHIEIEPTDAVVINTEWFLKKLEQYNTKATFFVLDGVAKKFPGLIKKIAQAGHEIASHGMGHIQIFKLEQEQFRKDIAESKKHIEDIISSPIFGYRAPAFSITPKTQWALDILAQENFKYDSSVFPISGKRYGWPGFSKGICKIALPSGRNIIEVPLSTTTIWGKTLPAAGGGYIRHFNYAITRWAIKRIEKTRPAIVYMHPYEIDTKERTLKFEHLSYKERFKAIKFHKMQKRNRNTMPQKINKLLSEFKFVPVRDLIKNIE
ncbi:MAG: DUF3473 domain-containing protein [Sedimentisphaerales bacterium]